jgi:3-dehydroquinate dehydratase-2
LGNKLYILNGPNLNLLGSREPEKYGTTSIEDLEALCLNACKKNNFSMLFFQSNFEGEIIEKIHAAQKEACGIIINAGALTHTSIAILDALSMYDGPKIEIHITNIYTREIFRHKSYISPVVTAIIAGLGTNSYILAISAINQLREI